MSRHTHNTEKSNQDSTKRSYNWGTIAYPESIKENWIEELQIQGIQTAISPLHDRDVTDSGEPKKPHYHVIFHFTTLKSQQQVRDIVSSIGAVGAEMIKSLKGSVQYLSHLNSPDKAQYNLADIQTLCGFDIGKYLPKADRYDMHKDIYAFIDANCISEYHELCTALVVAVESGELTREHYKSVVSNAFHWNSFLRSAQSLHAKRVRDKQNQELFELAEREQQRRIEMNSPTLEWKQVSLRWEDIH